MLAAQILVNQDLSQPSGVADLAQRLETARGVIETKFVSAGEVLSEAVDGIGALIGALDDLTGALDSAAITATVNDLQGAAETLTALPLNHHARRVVVSDLDRHRADLGGSLAEMRQSLAYMRAFTMNIKITAGGIVQAHAEFTLFAEEITARIEDGRSELDSLQRELDALRGPIASVSQQGEAMSLRCGELIPLLPDALNASAKLIGDHHRKVAMAAASSAGVAREIRSKVGRILAALQIGDITRQRIEHVQGGLALIDKIKGELPSAQGARATSLIEMLLASQLDDTMQGFEGEVSQISASMDGLASDAQALLKLRDLAYGQEREGQAGLLQTLEARLKEALTLVRELETTERDVLATAKTTARAAQIVAGRLAALQDIKSDVQYMAFNTTLKSSHIGEAGRPLATIAVELRIHASYLEQAANKSMIILNALTAAAAQLTGDACSESGDAPARFAAQHANQVLSGAARRIGDAGARTASGISRLAERGAAVLDLLNRSLGRFGFQEEIGHAVDEVAGELATLAQDAEPCDADIRQALSAALAKLYASYTMDQERSVHLAFAEAWDIGVTSSPPSVAPAPSDELEDVLF